MLAAGVVLWHGSVDDPQFLLLQNSRHGTWGLSKGHLEEGEDLRQGALRETLEETGYSLQLSDLRADFADTAMYQPMNGVWKRVVNFLAREAVDPAGLQRSEEHTEARWLTLTEALKLLEFEALRRTLIRAAHRLQEPE